MSNTVTVVGNLTRDPELRFQPSGQAMINFGIADNKVWTDRQTNERKESTSFFDVTCWGQLAENAAASLTKGARVVVSGRLGQRSWETQDGEKRSKIEITADEIGPSLRFATCIVERIERSERTQTAGAVIGRGGYAPHDEEPF